MGRDCASERGVRESSRVSRLGLASARENARAGRPPCELERPASLRGEAQKRPRRGRLVTARRFRRELAKLWFDPSGQRHQAA